jgi:FkbM family methyltransferase
MMLGIIAKARAAKANIEKKSAPLVARALRAAMKSSLPIELKRTLWHVANRNFLHNNAAIVGIDPLGNRLLCRTNDLVQKHIAIFGIWEPNLTAYLLAKKKVDGIFLDIGANIGYFSLLASRIFSRVIAFEPSPGVFESLNDNIRINHCRNVTAIQCAVTEKPGRMPFFRPPGPMMGTASLIEEDGRIFEGMVDCAPLQDHLSDADWRQVRYIKIDVEGAEVGVLKSLLRSRHLLTDDVEISIECGGPDEESTNVFNMLSEFGFAAFDLRSTYSLKHYLLHNPQKPIRIRSVPNSFTDCLYCLRPDVLNETGVQ